MKVMPLSEAKTENDELIGPPDREVDLWPRNRVAEKRLRAT
jgi:hypothetical protein